MLKLCRVQVGFADAMVRHGSCSAAWEVHGPARPTDAVCVHSASQALCQRWPTAGAALLCRVWQGRWWVCTSSSRLHAHMLQPTLRQLLLSRGALLVRMRQGHTHYCLCRLAMLGVLAAIAGEVVGKRNVFEQVRSRLPDTSSGWAMALGAPAADALLHADQDCSGAHLKGPGMPAHVLQCMGSADLLRAPPHQLNLTEQLWVLLTRSLCQSPIGS